MTTDVTIYGASDDLIEFDGGIDGEAYTHGSGESSVILTAPDGDTLTLDVEFCGMNPDGWGIRIESHGEHTPSWPIRFMPAPGPNPEGDPAVVVTVPNGTTATVDGEGVWS